ncbi:hypothetical protein IEO21_09082 [Rhodonia placenta]|uniref:Uncharacterized protein n=1 Tax=Rhodonia placenta TaxID=104341 RepID=A0A8H7TYK8_9APHY|nr:hypothetical protein IEO21_09082 [Postia placenta]
MAADNDSIRSGTSSQRSVSRGRDFQSSGRGGVGNIRRTSIDPNSPKTPNFNPEDDVTMNRVFFFLPRLCFPFAAIIFELIAPDRVFTDISVVTSRSFSFAFIESLVPDRLPTTGSCARTHDPQSAMRRNGRSARDVCAVS